MGGSGGGGAYRLRPSDIEQLRSDARERLEQSKRNSEVNTYLQGQLAELNDRDTEEISERLGDLEDAMEKEGLNTDRLLFGGSVAKHTYVDGLSDIDALVVFDDADASPEDLRNTLKLAVERQLDLRQVDDIRVGDLAVTISYRDGPEIQLLPTIEKPGGFAISSPDGSRWLEINPREFAKRLSALNTDQAGAVVPAIKLAKAVVENRFGSAALSGYHMEALAIAAFEHYNGMRTPKAMLQSFFESAASTVLSPIADVTGQSRYVDEYLGPRGSEPRRTAARGLKAIARAMNRAGSAEEWRSLVEG